MTVTPCPCGLGYSKPGSTNARVVGSRFLPSLHLYRADVPDSPLRTSRDEALEDYCALTHRGERP